ncbi:hypothetical protein [Pseudozobellia sp. WGM2]|uniref:hypothetical protein n=1 Tax=Pseudozobellia sp. WGM2 TaxID=2787625 RepID=UPI001ADFAD15|nr:hypothetical protein [Pseudozobellia sp. WGM2]
MASSKHSEEEILKLGKKLIQELKLEYSVNTLARWLVHYLAELIDNIENCKSPKRKKQLQKECCELILKLWSNKEFLPITKPLQSLQPILEILEVFKERDYLISPRWLEYRPLPRDNAWANFIDVVKNNTENIFNKSIELHLNSDLMFKDEQWLNEHKEFLTKTERELLTQLDTMIAMKGSSSIDFDKVKTSSIEERFNHIFDDLEELIEGQKKELLRLKESVRQTLSKN